MERQKIINDLIEWQEKDEENRAFILIISERRDEDNIEGNAVVQGKKQITCAALVEAIRNMPDLFRDASRLVALRSILKEEEKETDKDTNAVIN